MLIHHLLGTWRTDFGVSHTPKPVMLFGVLKAAVPLGAELLTYLLTYLLD